MKDFQWLRATVWFQQGGNKLTCFMSRMNLNAGYVASEMGTNISLQHREQWNGIHPFRFSQFGFNTTFGYCRKSKNEVSGVDFSYGIGVLITFGTEGIIPLNTLQSGILLGIALRRVSPNAPFRFASLELKMRNNNLSLSADDWVFSGQLDPVYGYNPSLLPNAPTPENLQKIFWDMGVGVVVSFNMLEGHINIGVSLDNIRSQDNLLEDSQGNIRPERLTVHSYFYHPFLAKINSFYCLENMNSNKC